MYAQNRGRRTLVSTIVTNINIIQKWWKIHKQPKKNPQIKCLYHSGCMALLRTLPTLVHDQTSYINDMTGIPPIEWADLYGTWSWCLGTTYHTQQNPKYFTMTHNTTCLLTFFIFIYSIVYKTLSNIDKEKNEHVDCLIAV